MLNVVLTVAGLALIGYGVYVSSVHGWATTLLPAALVCVGMYLSLFSFLYFMFGVKSYCFLTLYKMFMSLLLLAQIVYIILLMIPAMRTRLQQLINLQDLPAEQQDFFRKNFVIAAYMFLGLTLIEFTCICMAHCLMRKLEFENLTFDGITANNGNPDERKRLMISRETREFALTNPKELHYNNLQGRRPRHAQIYDIYDIKPRHRYEQFNSSARYH